MNPVWKEYQLKNDPTSYLLTGLERLKGWGKGEEGRDVVKVVQEAQKVLGKDFPFKQKKAMQVGGEDGKGKGQHEGVNPQIQSAKQTGGFNSNQYFPKSSPSAPSTTPSLPSAYSSGYGDPTHNAPRSLAPAQLSFKSSLSSLSQSASTLLQDHHNTFFPLQNLHILHHILTTSA